MTSPDSIVAARGETVTLTRVTVPVYDSYDELDVDASTIESVPMQAIPSLPSQRDLILLQGRDAVPSLRLTVDSATDIQRTRPGRPDEVTRGGILYRVMEVRDDAHYCTGTRKKTVFLESLPGR